MHKMQLNPDDANSKLPAPQSPDTLDWLRAEIRRLHDRISALENIVAAKPPAPASIQKQAQQPEDLPPDLLLVISAAIAAYLGVEPHIRQIRLLHSHPWGQQGRVTIQASHRIRASHG